MKEYFPLLFGVTFVCDLLMWMTVLGVWLTNKKARSCAELMKTFKKIVTDENPTPTGLAVEQVNVALRVLDSANYLILKLRVRPWHPVCNLLLFINTVFCVNLCIMWSFS